MDNEENDIENDIENDTENEIEAEIKTVKKTRKTSQFDETILSDPIKKYFKMQGYRVNGEVKSADITAILPLGALSKEGEILYKLVIIETKKNFGVNVLYQAMERLKTTNSVYVGVPRPKKSTRRTVRSMIEIVKKLELGLIFVDLGMIKGKMVSRGIEIIVEPKNTDKNKNNARYRDMIKEITSRSMDLNHGGSTGVKIMTGYREKSVCLAVVLRESGPVKVSKLRKIYPFMPEKSTEILYRNFLGWFDKEGLGLYRVNKRALAELEQKEYKPLVDFYIDKMKMEVNNEEYRKEYEIE